MATKTRSSSKRLSKNRPTPKRREAKKDLAETYNEFKQFEGQQYTGMTIGRSHKWYYDKGANGRKRK